LRVRKDGWELKKRFSNEELFGKVKYEPVKFTDGKEFELIGEAKFEREHKFEDKKVGQLFTGCGGFKFGNIEAGPLKLWLESKFYYDSEKAMKLSVPFNIQIKDEFHVGMDIDTDFKKAQKADL